MEKTIAGYNPTLVVFVVGLALFLFLSWKPVADRIEKLLPDSDQKFKAVSLVGCLIYVIVALAMSIGVMLMLLGYGGE